MALGCMERDSATGARELDRAMAFRVNVPAHVEAPPAPVRTAGFDCTRNHVKVMTGETIIKTSALTASA